MKNNIIYFLLISIMCVLVYSCNSSSALEESLQFAGENRAELEKVLKHYAKNKMKYKAACFLIENMPHYYSYKNGRVDQYVQDFYQTAKEHNGSALEAEKKLQNKYGELNPDEYKIVYDSHIITGNYLINNIEWAFKVWEEQPWNKDLSFSDFCEMILPYRVDDEPLEDWRELYYNTYQPILDSLLIYKTNPKEAIDVLWEAIHDRKWLYFYSRPSDYPPVGAATLETNHRMGDCYEYNTFAVSLMRALGIPGGTDAYLQYPYGQGHHLWNYVLDGYGNLWEFSVNGYAPRPASYRKKPIMGKVYRNCFAVQENSLPQVTQGKRKLPSLLDTRFKKDVSAYYLHDVSLEIEVGKEELKDEILYLCTFSNTEWVPVTWSIWENGKFSFNHVEKNMLYLPAYYKNDKIIPILCAGSVSDDGEYIPIEPSDETGTIYIERKFPIGSKIESYRSRIKEGKFQVSNDSDFKNAITLFSFEENAKLRWCNLKFPTTQKYKYVRFLSGENGYWNMAELEFLDEQGNVLSGKVIGTDGSYQNRSDNKKEAVFDKDPLTYFDAKEASGSWTGLDLGKPQYVSGVNYLFRNDDNNIRLGDLYELFYSDLNGWQSLGRRVADSGILTYENAPMNALFWLKNHTRGNEELPFFYKNGEQIFWER